MGGIACGELALTDVAAVLANIKIADLTSWLTLLSGFLSIGDRNESGVNKFSCTDFCGGVFMKFALMSDLEDVASF